MSLSVRLSIAFVLVAIGATGLAGFWVRRTMRDVLERDFNARVDGATREVKDAMLAEAQQLRDLVGPLCSRGTFFDKALVDLERAKGEPTKMDVGSLIALRRHVPDEAVARTLDGLDLVTMSGYVVSSSSRERIGTTDARMKAVVASPEARVTTEETSAQPWIETHCVRKEGAFALGLVGRRDVRAVLDRVGRAHGVVLSLLRSGDDSAPAGDVVARTVTLEEIANLRVRAALPRAPLARALSTLDRDIAMAGGASVLVALLAAIVLARSLARPIRELAHESREVLTGEPRPVKGRGGKEIAQLAESFNKTIEELTRMRKRLAATERIAARREIARQVAHEIKNPLAPIRAAVETLRRLKARDQEAFDEYFDEASKTVLEEVHRIANIVSEFTKFSRLPPPNPEPMDLVAMAKGVVALHAADPDMVRTGSEAPKRVELAVEDGVPSIRADKDQLVQVLTNLVQNGLEAASEVREDPRVVVSIAKLDARRVRIVVRDNGLGVAEEMRDRLFEPYATSKATGTGLGLAICQRIVFEHGGEIAYRPATKGGAVFEITLPIAGPSLLDKSIEITQNPVSRFDTAAAETKNKRTPIDPSG